MVKELEKFLKSPTDARTILNPLFQLAKKLVGDETSGQVIEECAIWLLIFFLDKHDVSHKDVAQLKASLPSIDMSTSKEILKVINNKDIVFTVLIESVYIYLFRQLQA